MQLNRQPTARLTHEGARAKHISPLAELRRSVLSCLLWENGFYENGVEIAERIQANASKVLPSELASLAIEARKQMHLRHVPLLLLVELSKRRVGRLTGDTIAEVISRPDELTELVAMWWSLGNPKNLPKQMRRGLALAFPKFDEYQLAKYDRDTLVKLRDVMRLTHPKPAEGAEQSALFKRVLDRELARPNTWESRLAGGEDKKAVFTELLVEGRLGYLALLRNLRGMRAAGVDSHLIEDALLANRGAHNVLPFRYIAAARACPELAPVIDQALKHRIDQLASFSGTTCILVDVSGSMGAQLSSRSDLTRMDAAAALAAVFPGRKRVFSFSAGVRGRGVLVECPSYNGLSCIEGIIRSQYSSGTLLGHAIHEANELHRSFSYDRLIVVTDEQSHDRVPDPACPLSYMVNVAMYQNGVGYGKWTHIDGFSEGILRYMQGIEEVGVH